MANHTVSLLRYAKLPDIGWRRGKAIIGKTGKLTPDYMLIGKRNEKLKVYAPEGRYELRYFDGNRPRYKDVGNDPGEALEQLKQAQSELKLKNAAKDAGFVIPLPKQAKRKTLAEFGREFLEHKKSPSLGLSEDTINLYTAIVEEFVPVSGKTYSADVTEADVIRYCDVLDKRYSDRVRATRYKSLRGFLFYCEVEPKRLISASVHKRLKSYEKKKIRIYSGGEIATLLGVCDSYHHMLFMVALLTGMRDRELAHLLWQQVDFEANLIRLQDYVIQHKGKTITFKLKDGEARDIPIFPVLREQLLRWRKERPNSVFVLGTKKDRPNVKILDALKRKARKAGLNCGLCLGCAARRECHHFHTHYFRSSFASYALKRNDIRKVQEWMGHSDLATLAQYVGAADNCPAWLSDLYVLPETSSSAEEKMPSSISFPTFTTKKS